MEAQPVATREADAPEAEGVHHHRQQRHLVAAQGVRGHRLQAVEELVEQQIDDEPERHRLHRRVGARKRHQRRAQHPQQRTDQQRETERQEHAEPRGAVCAPPVIGAGGLTHQHHGGDRQRQGQHVDHAGEVGDDAVPGHRLGADAGREDGDEGEGADVDEGGQAHRQTEAQQLAKRLCLRRLPGVEDAIGPVGGIQNQIDRTTAEGEPAHQRGGQPAPGATQRGKAERTVGQRPGQRNVRRGGDGADRHQHARTADGVVERVKGAVEQHRRQADRRGGQVIGGLRGDVGRHVSQREQIAGRKQQRDPGHRQQQREPEALLQRRADRLLTAGADMVGDGRRHRLQRAGEQHHHRDVVATADRHPGQVGGAVAPGDHGVGDHHGHRQQLGDQDWPGQM